MRSRIVVGLIAGTVGAFVGGLISEVLVPYNSYIKMINGVCTAVAPTSAAPALIVAFCVYGITGMCLGAVDGIVEGNTRKFLQGMLLGAVGSFLIGAIGSQIGGRLYNSLGGSMTAVQSVDLLSFLRQIVARAMDMMFIGLGIGIGASLATRSAKRIRNGALGGLIGGFVGGALFDILGNIIAPVQSTVHTSGCFDAGGTSRMVSYVLIGGLTGFFIGLVEELLKQAWVKVLAGRNEGKDFILSKPMNLLGRNERCDVPLYGDNSVGVQHAAIRADGNRHVLLDAGTPAGTVVNGQRAEPGKELLLRDGDMIQIGTHRILFREKATASKFARAPVDEPKSKPGGSSVPMPSHLCPFCGAPKDANGNCLCTVAGGTGASPVGVGTGMGAPTSVAAGGPSASGYGASPASAPYAPPTAIGSLAGAHRLIGVGGPYTGQVFPLSAPNTLLGREAGCDIALTADSTISRNHARLVEESGGLVVYDNGSSNGTFVNGMRVTAPTMLALGDVVQFGSSSFKLE